jgi:hypothetical protein
LIIRWKDHKGFLRQETNAKRLREHNERHGYKNDSPLVRALEEVFERVGDHVRFNGGNLSGFT